MQEVSNKKERVIAYIDGFNLYFGIREAGFDYCRWLDLKKMVQKLMKSNQSLEEVKYFTSRVSNDPQKQKRQANYIDALESTGIKVLYGNYQNNAEECKRCGHSWKIAKEKMTDVNIATNMIVDGFNDLFDMALLISGDSDLVPPIRATHNHLNQKRVCIAFPPKRHNASMSNAAKGSFTIGRKTLIDSLFNQEVKTKTGYIIKAPVNWLP
jgi:uncharacterized LabA/DUF88 family protein